MLAGVSAFFAGAAVAAIWLLPSHMYPDKGDADARATLQGGLLTAAAALLAVAGGLVALDETRQANAETKRSNEASDERERLANANAHVREFYVSAIELLGSDKLDVRLGALYALERVANDSPADQRTVVEVLSAFVREHASQRDPAAFHRPTSDVQAALTILGRLPSLDGVLRADLTGADLTGATLASANLAGATLERVILDQALIANVDFTGTNLNDSKIREPLGISGSFNKAVLCRASLRRTDFSMVDIRKTIFLGADLAEAILWGRLDDADLHHAKLHGANFGFAQGLTQDQIDSADGDARTLLPPSLTRPATWT